jgi:hypothetical protein
MVSQIGVLKMKLKQILEFKKESQLKYLANYDQKTSS